MVPINFVRSPSTANQDGFFAEGCKTARRGKIDNVDTTGTAQRPNPEQGEGGGKRERGERRGRTDLHSELMGLNASGPPPLGHPPNVGAHRKIERCPPFASAENKLFLARVVLEGLYCTAG